MAKEHKCADWEEKEKSRSARNVPSGLHDFRTAEQKSLTWLNTLSPVNSNSTWLLCKQGRSEHEQRAVMVHSFFREQKAQQHP